eukprot:PhF_6_TR21714/c0_g1_i2/m.31024
MVSWDGLLLDRDANTTSHGLYTSYVSIACDIIVLSIMIVMRLEHKRPRNRFFLNVLLADVLHSGTFIALCFIEEWRQPLNMSIGRWLYIATLSSRATAEALLAVHLTLRVYQHKTSKVRLTFLIGTYVVPWALIGGISSLSTPDRFVTWWGVILGYLFTVWALQVISSVIAARRLSTVYPAMLRSDIDTAALCRRDMYVSLLTAGVTSWGPFTLLLTGATNAYVPSWIESIAVMTTCSVGIVIAVLLIFVIHKCEIWESLTIPWCVGFESIHRNPHPSGFTSKSRRRRLVGSSEGSGEGSEHTVYTAIGKEDDHHHPPSSGMSRLSAEQLAQTIVHNGASSEDRHTYIMKWSS